MKDFSLEVWGEYACFTRPEMKVERVSYDVITPSAARAIFEAILWKPAIRWHIRKVEVLKPIQWFNIRRNEVSDVISAKNVVTTMKNGRGVLALYADEKRQQRASLLLRDVHYRINAALEVLPDVGPENSPPKFWEMFERRSVRGQCFHQPYLGCREFPAHFRLCVPTDSLIPPISDSRDLGFMLYDLDYSANEGPSPRFFRAVMEKGTVKIPAWNSNEVLS